MPVPGRSSSPSPMCALGGRPDLTVPHDILTAERKHRGSTPSSPPVHRPRWGNMMHGLRPTRHDLDDARLATYYAYPDGPTAPFVRVNFVTSADGAASVNGRSA